MRKKQLFSGLFALALIVALCPSALASPIPSVCQSTAADHVLEAHDEAADPVAIESVRCEHETEARRWSCRVETSASDDYLVQLDESCTEAASPLRRAD